MSFNTGATFVPGGDDSYFLPEVIAPAPQRFNEHPTNMRQNVAQMEHEARNNTQGYGSPRMQPQQQFGPRPAQNTGDQQGFYQQSSGYSNGPQASQQQQDYAPAYNQQPQRTTPSPRPPPQQQQQQQNYAPNYNQQPSRATPSPRPQPQQQASYGAPPEIPNFSPFPILRNPGPNIPPTDEQKEAVLESAREAVLGCNDPDQQLTWAQDALSYVEIAIQNEARLSRTQPGRPRTPKIEHQLREDAMKVTNFLADQHHPKAEFMRGMWYEFGKFGFPLDKPESFQCYKRAADRGYARAWYRMGMQFESGNDPLTAIKYYRMAADAGDSAACYRLGMMTLLGQHGQQQDYEQGLQLIYAAAHSADDNAPQGAYVLGMLQAGELAQVNVPERFLARNTMTAKINLERAAFLGFAKAQVRMGSAYELGELNCNFDPALSLHYNALAARQGEVEAEMAISKWFLCGHEGVFEKNEQMAFTYAQRAAVDGLATAQFAMGYFYEVGIYVQSDLKQAKEWYKKSDEGGNKDARKRIDAVSRSKTISRKEHEAISLQRIRQQHGYGASLAPSSDAPSGSLEMPDIGKMNLNQPYQGRPAGAPYPDGSTGSNPELRSGSAFGINPNLRPQPAPTQNPGRDPYNNQMGPPQRPYSSLDVPPAGSYGRTSSGGPPQGYGGLDQRPLDRPATVSPHTSPYIGSQPDRRQPQRPGPPPQTNSAPQVNLGFTAPLDSQGADRPNWTPHMSGSGEGPRPPRDGRSDAYSRTSSGLPSQQGGRPPANQGYQPNPNRPQGGGSGQTRPPTQQRPPQQVSQGRPPVQPAAPSSPPAKVNASAAASRPPGKGPKTFAEMGIPQSKDEKDCVVM